MRNLKKLLAVIVAICVLATFTVPAFAETKTDAAICTDLGVIKGTGDGVSAEYLATQPDRLQGAIMFLRLKGLEDEAKAFTGTDNFADIAGLNDTNKAILAYLKANPDLGFGGIGGNKFAATEKMEAKQYYKVLLTALGYTYGTDDTADFTWNNVMSFAASKGLVKMADVTKFTVNDLCIATVEALKVTVKGGTDTLIAKLVLAGDVAADVAASTGLYVPSAVALTVTSVTADNLIVAKLVFNKELNKDTVTTTNIAATDLDTVTLGADNKTVYAKLKANTVAQDKVVEFTIKNVKDITGATIAETKKTVTFRDTGIPSISGVTVKNAKTLVISASEPMMYNKITPEPLASVKVDGNVQYGTTTVDYVNNTITVKLYTAIATGTRKIDIADLTDYAGYKAVAQSYNVEVVEDKTAPVLVSAKVVTSTKIEATFDEIIAVGAAGTFTVAGYTVDSATVNANDNTKVDIVLNSSTPLGIGAIVEIKIGYVDTQDVMGNKVATTQYYTFKVEDDTSLPTVTAAIAEGNVITLTFSKPMQKAGTIKILKASDASAIAGVADISVATQGFVADTNDTVIKLSGITNQDPLDIKVNITGMKDASVRSNPLAEQNLALRFLDTKVPVVQANYVTAAGETSAKDTVTFFFSEPMNVDTIKALSNYLRAGTPLTAVSGAELKAVAADGKSVTFIVPSANSRSDIYTVYAVKDLAGNPAAMGSTVNPPSGITALSAQGAKAVAKNKIEVYFQGTLGVLDYTAFAVKLSDGSYVYAKSATLVNSTTASIELWSNLPANTTGASVELALARVKDAYGTALAASGTALVSGGLVDGIKPTATVATGTSTGSIKVTFDEDIRNASTAAASIVVYKDGAVSGLTYTFFDANNNVVTGVNNFRYVVIEGLTSATSYSVIVNPTAAGLLDVTAGNAANFLNTSATAK